MRLIKVLLLITALFLAAGCTTVTPQGKAIRDLNANDSAYCKYLSDLEGKSGVGDLASPIGIEDAKNLVREKAAKLGATHVVWDSIEGGTTPMVKGRAFKCPPHIE